MVVGREETGRYVWVRLLHQSTREPWVGLLSMKHGWLPHASHVKARAEQRHSHQWYFLIQPGSEAHATDEDSEIFKARYLLWEKAKSSGSKSPSSAILELYVYCSLPKDTLFMAHKFPPCNGMKNTSFSLFNVGVMNFDYHMLPGVLLKQRERFPYYFLQLCSVIESYF